MKRTEHPTIFIVDDDEDVRDALSMLMRSAQLHAETFATAKDFLHSFTQHDSGCLVLDIRMPGMSGLELQAELHKRRIKIPIVFLTGHGDVPLAVKAMKAGAADFIQKPLDEHRLVMAVMNSLKLNGDRGQQHNLLGSDSPDAADKLDTLSRREGEVLEHVIEGMQNREIAETLCISIKTVEFHRANIREKLGVSNLPDLFRLVLGKRAGQ